MIEDSTARSARGVYGTAVASELSGIAPQTLRLYERRGLLTPARTAGGTRRYSDDDLQRLQRITELANQGINLTGIAQILDLETKNDQLKAGYTALELSNAELRAVAMPPAWPVAPPGRTKGGVPVMKDVENIVLPDEAPAADAMEQRLVVDADDETGLDASQVDTLGDRDASEADVIDQAIVVSIPEDDRDPR